MALDKIIDKLLLYNDLENSKARFAFQNLLNGKLDQKTAKALLVLLRRKGETATELFSLIQAARMKNGKRVTVRSKQKNLCDACGTGGDGQKTFNVSTISSLVAAGAGAKIAKHGNRSITSSCGSSDLMEALGVKLDATPKAIARSIDRSGIGYFHAPLHSKAFANVQGIRKELAAQKIKTIFNMAGPLLNPLHVKRQVVGVYHPRMIPIVLNTLKKLGTVHAIVLSGKNGTDELTTYQPTFTGELKKGIVRYFKINPSAYGLRTANIALMRGGSAAKNLKIALDLLTGRDKSARRDVILANAGLILYVSQNAKNLHDGIRRADRALKSGRALRVIAEMKKATHAA